MESTSGRFNNSRSGGQEKELGGVFWTPSPGLADALEVRTKGKRAVQRFPQLLVGTHT